jgi:multisubunit Na+/H+ antiporter MnhB subunit
MRADRVVPAILVAAAAAALGWALAAVPEVQRIAPLVEEHLPASGVDNQVTAVLLNFRGYDTLLEIAVLLLSAVGVMVLWSGGAEPGTRERLHHGPIRSPMLAWYVVRLWPIVLLFGAHMWWTGASHPGGAFQAGAVLAGGVALLLLSGMVPPPVRTGGLRAALVVGLLVFLAAAAVPLAIGNAVLGYPEGWSKPIIATVEAFATVSIAAALAVMMAGAPQPDPPPEDRAG